MSRSRAATFAALGGFLLVYAVWQLTRFGAGSAHQALIGDLAFVPVNVAGCLACLVAARRGSANRRLRSAWRLMALGLFCYLVGDLLQTYYEVIAGSKPYPSLADVAYLAIYPVTLAGVLRFPTRAPGGARRREMIIDLITVALAGAAVVWYVVLGPTAVGNLGGGLQAVFSIAYPVGDLILIVGLAHVLLREPIASAKAAVRCLAAGMVAFVAADLIYGYVTVHSSYTGGDRLDSFWMLSLSGFLVAGLLQRQSAPGEHVDDAVERRRPSWVPWIAVAAVFSLLIVAERHDDFFPTMSLILAAVLVAVLVALRQLLAQRELLITHAELEQAHAELAALATTDAMTGLPNHRSLTSSIERELERSRRYGRQFAVLFLDVDHFKALNDGCGHGAGDAVLRELGAVASRCLRSIDTVGRWGGEEFVFVLPEIDADAALEAAERVRVAIGAQVFSVSGGLHLTCSVGVALYPGDATTRTALIDAADRAMYTAKRLGRNQTLPAHHPAVAALQNGEHQGSSRDDQALMGAVDALVHLVDVRDSYTGEHATYVGELASQVALELGCDEEEARAISIAARLHDIGKVAVPDSVLQKPGRLNAEEWALMARHPVVGAEVIELIPSLCMLAPIIRSHHERWDGSGYPDGLATSAIPFGARIVSVVDAFSAMTTSRVYREARPFDDARAELQRCSGSQFDPTIVRATERILETTAKLAVV